MGTPLSEFESAYATNISTTTLPDTSFRSMYIQARVCKIENEHCDVVSARLSLSVQNVITIG